MKKRNYFSSGKVRHAARMKALANHLSAIAKRLPEGSPEREQLEELCDDADLKISLVEEELFFHKRCPFVNDCIMFCGDAACVQADGTLRRTFEQLIADETIIV